MDGRELLVRLLHGLEEGWVDQDHRDLDAIAIREHLGLCRSGGCMNLSYPAEEADGWCSECLGG